MQLAVDTKQLQAYRKLVKIHELQSYQLQPLKKTHQKTKKLQTRWTPKHDKIVNQIKPLQAFIEQAQIKERKKLVVHYNYQDLWKDSGNARQVLRRGSQLRMMDFNQARSLAHPSQEIRMISEAVSILWKNKSNQFQFIRNILGRRDVGGCPEKWENFRCPQELSLAQLSRLESINSELAPFRYRHRGAQMPMYVFLREWADVVISWYINTFGQELNWYKKTMPELNQKRAQLKKYKKEIAVLEGPVKFYAKRIKEQVQKIDKIVEQIKSLKELL